MALSLPIVKAEDMQDTNDDDSAVVQEEQVTTTNEGEAVTTTQGEEEVGTTENSGETATQEQVEYCKYLHNLAIEILQNREFAKEFSAKPEAYLRNMSEYANINAEVNIVADE